MSSTRPHKIYLVKRCFNVAATFVSNEHTVIIEQSMRDLKTLLQRCKNVRYYSLIILKKAHLIRIFNIFFYNLPYMNNDFYRLRTSSTLPSQIYLVIRYHNVAATFVANEYSAIFQKYVRDLTKRCCNVVKR